MLTFYMTKGRKCADAPVYGKTRAKNVKIWSVCLLWLRKEHQNAQKRDLCSFFSKESRENEQTLHNMEKAKAQIEAHTRSSNRTSQEIAQKTALKPFFFLTFMHVTMDSQ